MAEKKDLKFPKGIFGKIINTQKGTIGKVSIRKKEFIEYLQSLPDDSEYLNLDILKRTNPTDKQTHYITVDEWKPTLKVSENTNNNTSSKEEDDLFDFAN